MSFHVRRVLKRMDWRSTYNIISQSITQRYTSTPGLSLGNFRRAGSLQLNQVSSFEPRIWVDSRTYARPSPSFLGRTFTGSSPSESGSQYSRYASPQGRESFESLQPNGNFMAVSPHPTFGAPCLMRAPTWDNERHENATMLKHDRPPFR